MSNYFICGKAKNCPQKIHELEKEIFFLRKNINDGDLSQADRYCQVLIEFTENYLLLKRYPDLERFFEELTNFAKTLPCEYEIMKLVCEHLEKAAALYIQFENPSGILDFLKIKSALLSRLSRSLVDESDFIYVAKKLCNTGTYYSKLDENDKTLDNYIKAYLTCAKNCNLATNFEACMTCADICEKIFDYALYDQNYRIALQYSEEAQGVLFEALESFENDEGKHLKILSTLIRNLGATIKEYDEFQEDDEIFVDYINKIRKIEKCHFKSTTINKIANVSDKNYNEELFENLYFCYHNYSITSPIYSEVNYSLEFAEKGYALAKICFDKNKSYNHAYDLCDLSDTLVDEYDSSDDFDGLDDKIHACKVFYKECRKYINETFNSSIISFEAPDNDEGFY